MTTGITGIQSEADSNQGIRTSPALAAILSGGLTVGILDTLLAMSLWQVSPIPIYQSIASGLLGIAAYDGGLPTAALGMFLHFFIATAAAAVYWFASHRLPIVGPLLITRWFSLGLAYGGAVYYFMQMVIHLSRFPVGSSPKLLWRVLGSILGHAFLVGLPIAWITQLNSPTPRRP